MRDDIWIIGIGVFAVFALVVHTMQNMPKPVEVAKIPNARDTAGMSNAPQNSDLAFGPAWLIANTRPYLPEPFYRFPMPEQGFLVGKIPSKIEGQRYA